MKPGLQFGEASVALLVRMVGIALLLGGLLGNRVVADGKIFPLTAYPLEVRIPDQRALLWWSNDVERLVIETRFTGQGTQFAWVVPLPSVPKVETTSRGLFPTLTHLLRPRVIHAPAAWWQLGVFLTGLLWLLITVRADGRLRWPDVFSAATMGVGANGIAEDGTILFGLIVFAITVLVTYRARTPGLKFFEFLLSILVFGLLLALFLPALAKAKAGGSSELVEILDRQLVGIFDTTTITGRDPKALRGWLNNNGYALSPDSEPVIADYLREGWVFVASKVRRDASVAETNSLSPLSFTFATKVPVYPLRLTGVGNGNLEVDLFVFGPERAQANGFEVRDCRPTQYPPTASAAVEHWWPAPNTLPMAHEGLRGVVPSAAYVTRLQGTLTPAQMREDAVIRWDGFAEQQDVLYSVRGAEITVGNWTLNGFCLVVLVVAIVSRARGVEPRQYARVTWFAGIVAVLATGVLYARLPVVPVTLEKHFARRHDAKNLQLNVRLAILDELNTNAPITLEAVRAAIQRGLPFYVNQYSNQVHRPISFQIREEDSPYHYSLRANSNGVVLLLYDYLGREESYRLPE